MKIIMPVLGVIALSLIDSEVFSLVVMSVLMIAGLIALMKEYERR